MFFISSSSSSWNCELSCGWAVTDPGDHLTRDREGRRNNTIPSLAAVCCWWSPTRNPVFNVLLIIPFWLLRLLKKPKCGWLHLYFFFPLNWHCWVRACRIVVEMVARELSGGGTIRRSFGQWPTTINAPKHQESESDRTLYKHLLLFTVCCQLLAGRKGKEMQELN